MSENFDRAISLGTHCYAANMLSQTGVRSSSYPFDWLFSNISMNTLCIKDNFKDLLDKTLYIEHSEGVGHSIYSKLYNRPLIFYHSDPRTEDGYAQLSRRIVRFLDDIKTGKTYFFVVTHPRGAPKEAIAELDSVLSLCCPQHHLEVVLVDDCNPQLTAPIIDGEATSPTLSTWSMTPMSPMAGKSFGHDTDDEAIRDIVRRRMNPDGSLTSRSA